MNKSYFKAAIMFFIGLGTMTSAAQALRANTPQPGSMEDEVSVPDYGATAGIVGNGVLGIVGNGVLQQISPAQIVLNDRSYLTGPRTIKVTIDFQPASLEDIGPGHVLKINGQATATSNEEDVALRTVELDSLIRGEVQTVVATGPVPSVNVLNQTVTLQNYSVIYDGANEIDLVDIQPGEPVRVSGWLDHLGTPVVTRIDRLNAPPSSLEVSGAVTTVDPAAAEIRINNLTVDYSSATFIFMNEADLFEGLQLEVAGNLLINGDTLQAATIRPVGLTLNTQSQQEFDLEGVVSTPISTSIITLDGVAISYTSQTLFDRGTQADLEPGRIVEVDGQITPTGTLLADIIRFNEDLLESEIRIFAVIEDLDFPSKTITAMGLPVTYSAATRFDDQTGSATTVDSIEQLAIGDYVEIRGYDQPDGQYMVAATRIRLETPDSNLLRARVDSISGNSLYLLGRQVITDNATVYETSAGEPLTSEEFFSTVQAGDLINAKGLYSGGELLAFELSFED